jgi:hypothetical protein
MSRTMPLFRISLAMQEAKRNLFHNALDKIDRKKFDDEMLFDIPRSYISACSYSVQYLRVHPILMSIRFHAYRQLTECAEQVEHMMVKLEGLEKEQGDTLLGYIC